MIKYPTSLCHWFRGIIIGCLPFCAHGHSIVHKMHSLTPYAASKWYLCMKHDLWNIDISSMSNKVNGHSNRYLWRAQVIGNFGNSSKKMTQCGEIWYGCAKFILPHAATQFHRIFTLRLAISVMWCRVLRLANDPMHHLHTLLMHNQRHCVRRKA